jgi:mRNA interferase MazF
VHRDAYSISLDNVDFESGQLNVRSFIRPNRLFTVERSVILYTAARLTSVKLDETLSKLRVLFS